ncbi:MAG: chemotaxis protein CheX [Oligoflexia bacterium]|nr:chemotaxis protein CheX [Oligoflexia bacterium]
MSQPPTLVLNDALVKTVIKCVQTSFFTLFGVQANAGTPSNRGDYASKADISGIMGMVQAQIEGNLVVSFQKAAIFTLLEKTYGKKFTELNESVRQGVGELTNIVYSRVKKELNDKGHQFVMSIPTVIIGSGHAVYSLHEGPTLVVPFSIEQGEFYVEIALQNK